MEACFPGNQGSSATVLLAQAAGRGLTRPERQLPLHRRLAPGAGRRAGPAPGSEAALKVSAPLPGPRTWLCRWWQTTCHPGTAHRLRCSQVNSAKHPGLENERVGRELEVTGVLGCPIASSEENAQDIFSRKTSWFPFTEAIPPLSQAQGGNKEMEKIILHHTASVPSLEASLPVRCGSAHTQARSPRHRGHPRPRPGTYNRQGGRHRASFLGCTERELEIYET